MAVLPSKKTSHAAVVVCLLITGLLAGCAHNAQPVVYTPQPVPSITAEEKAAQEAALAARQAEEKRAAELAAQEAAKAEAAKAASDQARQQAARQAVQQQPAPQAAKPVAPRPQVATGNSTAGTPRPSAGQTAANQASASKSASASTAAEKRSTEVAKQQARIAQLRKQIADNKAETTKVESANNSLKQAIKAAETLSATLSEEQKKYTAADPKTGKPAEPLAKNKIEQLSAEVQKLSKEAAALTAKPGK